MPPSDETAAYAVFREILKDFREDAKLTQAQLAGRLRVPQSYVSKYETGERRLDFVETVSVCRELTIPIAAFVKRFESRLRKEAGK